MFLIYSETMSSGLLTPILRRKISEKVLSVDLCRQSVDLCRQSVDLCRQSNADTRSFNVSIQYSYTPMEKI